MLTMKRASIPSHSVSGWGRGGGYWIMKWRSHDPTLFFFLFSFLFSFIISCAVARVFMKHGLTSHIELWSEPGDELPSREPPPHSPLCVPCCILPRCKSSSPEASTLAPRGTSCKMNQQPSRAGWLKWKWQGTCLGGTGAQLCCLSDKQAQYSSC